MNSRCFRNRLNAFSLTEVIIVSIIVIVVVGTIAGNWNKLTSYLNVSDTEKALLEMRSDITQTYAGSIGFSDLTNDVVLKAKLVPHSMLRGDTIVNAWGGEVTFSPTDGGESFSITFTEIPQGECVKLSMFQPSAWETVEVNGSELAEDQRTVGQVSGLCIEGKNTLIFTSSRSY